MPKTPSPTPQLHHKTPDTRLTEPVTPPRLHKPVTETVQAEAMPDDRITALTTNTARQTTPTGPNPWHQCSSVRSPAAGLDPDSISRSRKESSIDVDANSVKLQDGTYALEGNVILKRADQLIEAEHLVYDKQQGSVTAEGNIRYNESGLAVSSERLELDINTNHARLEEVDYQLPSAHARGSASEIVLEGPGTQKLTDASYTTCEPGQEDWLLSAKQVTLMQEEGVGRARGVKMRFKSVPIFYTPFLSFPLDDRRKSGLLAPTFGASEESGADIRIPYYWNIAPNHDATFTPRWLAKRGAQLGAEFRYLNPRNRGEATVEYLPSDDETGEDRTLISLEHRGQLNSRLKTVLLFNDVSDQQYFEDLGDSLNLASITHLERRLETNYQGKHWRMLARIQDFQTVDSTIADIDKPYARLPQIRLAGTSPWQPLGLHATLNTEYTYFDHDEDVTGHRLDVQPRVSLPIRGAAYAITPQASIRHTRYELDDPLTPGASVTPERTTPVYSVDSRLFLERESSWRSRKYTQTLEPRLFYLYVPNKNQDDLPVFDTGELDFQYNQLFAENRFSGADRMGDANQLTFALSTRILDPDNGKQYLRASLGQIFYFRDLKVTLPGEPELTERQSNIIGDLELKLFRQWQLSSGIQWNPDKARADRAQVRLQYSPDPRHIANLSYRFRRDILEQVDASLRWQVARNWSAVGRWYYSLDDDLTLESFGGIEYDSCCWAMRFVSRNYVNRDNGEHNRSFYLQLEFKGLGAIGKPVEDLLERGILGYRRNP